MLKLTRKGQSTIEYAILLIIILGAFLAVGNYFKRGVQGRWKASVDDLGDQYDPRVANTNLRHIMFTNTSSRTDTQFVANVGYWTIRTDLTNALELKQGYEGVDGY